MESWEVDFEWLRVRHQVKDALGRTTLPDLQAILFLIGVQELGQLHKQEYTKEEKRDLMHVAVCTLLEDDGYYSFVGRDQDGWPHFSTIKPFDIKGLDDQESVLIRAVIRYFNNLDQQSKGAAL